MAYKTTKTQPVPSRQFERANTAAVQIRREAVVYRDQAIAGSVRLLDIEFGMLGIMTQARTVLLAAQATPNIVAYAKDQFEASYEIATEFTAMMNQLDITLTWFENNFPIDAGGHLQSSIFIGDGSGITQSALLTDSAALTALIARLDALISTID